MSYQNGLCCILASNDFWLYVGYTVCIQCNHEPIQMTDHVTQNQFNSQLVLIHQTMRDNQKDSFDSLQIVSKNVEKIAISVERLQTEQNIRLDNHGERLSSIESMVKVNNEQRIVSKAYWGIAAVIATTILGVVVKLLFFPAP